MGALTAILRAEYRKAVSVKLWWALLIPAVALAALVNAFGGLFTAALSDVGTPSLLPVSLAYSLSLTSAWTATPSKFLPVIGAAPVGALDWTT